MKYALGFLCFTLAPIAMAESSTCPAELLDTGLLQLQRSGDGLLLTHGVLGTRQASIVGETDRHLCASVTDLSGEVPSIYLFCLDKREKTIAVTHGKPYGDPDPEMMAWSHAKCFVGSGAGS